MRCLALSLLSVSCVLASVSVKDGCTEDSSVVATIQESDAIQVNHGVVGEATPCYAVLVHQPGADVHGYVLGNTLPAIVEFERLRALESRVPIPEPPPPPPGTPAAKKAQEARPTGPPFEPWSGTDITGKRIQLGDGNSKVTVVTFWLAQSAPARRSAENLEKTWGEFRRKGVQTVGLVQASPSRLGYFMDDMGLDYPVAYDRGLAAKYGADAAKGTTLVIDSSNHIIASTSDPKEIRAAVVKLLSLE
jgi:peroxiredoxin